MRYDAISLDAYRALGFPGVEELANMFQFKQEFNTMFCSLRSLDVSRSLNPALQSFAHWLATNKHRIPIEETA